MMMMFLAARLRVAAIWSRTRQYRHSPGSATNFGFKTLGQRNLSCCASQSGILMAAVARVRLEMFPERRRWMLRGLTPLIVGVEPFRRGPAVDECVVTDAAHRLVSKRRSSRRRVFCLDGDRAGPDASFRSCHG